MKKFFTFIAVLTLCAELWAINNVPYIDANGQLQYRDSVTGVINSTDTLKTGWYVVMPTGNEKQTGTLVCQGEVHLIVYDGAKLTATGANGKPGIEVSGEGNSLTIYGYINQSGQLIAIGGARAAGIGGGYDGSGSNITINGGAVAATGGEYAAGIGGGYTGSGSNITINGGTVTATGGDNAAGIGGGIAGNGSNITINGGAVTATGGENAAGIGGGYWGSGSNITINGGTVTANGGSGAAGIGGGYEGSGSNIIVSTNLIVKADGNNPPTTVITNTGSDLASSLNGKQYVTIESIPATVPVSYLSPVYNTTGDPTSGILRWDTLQCTNYTLVTDTTTTLNAGWYVVTGSDVQTGTLTCNGAVNLILADGAQLTASGTSDEAGITVSGTGNSLTIYAQSTEPTQMGELTATTGGDYAAGIGGGDDGSGSNITINGGEVTATGGERAAGIGGGAGDGSNITINGGDVTATGGLTAAGIGGAASGSGSNITINGGTVTTTGGERAAGIGGGVAGNGSNITINGGEVTATGGEYAAGIGGGYLGNGSNITINGGEVIATGGDYAVGIGGGYDGSGSNIIVSTNLIVKADGNNPPTTVITNTGSDLASSLDGKQYVTIESIPASVPVSYLSPVYNTTGDTTSGILRWDTLQCTDYTLVTDTTTTLNAGWYVVTGSDVQTGALTCNGAVNLILADGAQLTASGTSNVAGITVSGTGNSLTIYAQSTEPTQMGELTATSGNYASGIGGGYDGSGSNITINGGAVAATGGYLASGIGGGAEASGSNITINGGTVTANGGLGAAGIGGGYDGSGSNITINSGEVIATGGDNAAGIGGGYDGSGSNITINGGAVTATGGVYGAGIGGGISGNGSNITINGDTVTANGGLRAAGIGGGGDGSGSNITINGGEVIATGGDDASGIGGGYWGSGSNIIVSTNLIVKADGTNPPTTVITNTGSDLASSLNGKQYVTTAPAPVPVSYLSPVYNTTGDPTSGILRWDTLQCTDYTLVENTTTTLNAGWYVVTGTDVQTGALTCNGAVNLILADGAQLTASGTSNVAGITVSGTGNSLTIYAQSTEPTQMGELTATGGNSGAGIGGGDRGYGSNITINGGTITANGGGSYGAGIGGGYSGSGSNITINGGEVIATGGYQASGIGGGLAGSGSNITINGGAVTATGGYQASGIGGGTYGSGSNIIVSTNLVVKAGNTNPPTTVITNTGSDLASSLNGKQYVTTAPAPSYRTPVYNTTDDPTSGILRWDTLQCTDYTLVTDTTTTLNAGWYVVTGSDVQTGALTCNGAVNLILANGAQLTASGTSDVAGITVSGTGNSLTIYAQSTEPTQMGELTATGGEYAAGIGGGKNGSGSNITINGGEVIATGGNLASGIGGGLAGSGSNITINGGTVTANGGLMRASGIGGGKNGSGSNITINGGEVAATGGVHGAGIGGGYDGSGSNVTINGGAVTATGGNYAAGIGGGYWGSGSNIIVSTNLIVKAGNTNPPTTVITNTGSDLASSLVGKQYVTTTPPSATITATVNDTAMGSVTGAGTYDYGTQITLTATHAAHYHFVNWSNGSTVNPLTVTVEKDTSITANFAPDTFTVTLAVNDAAMGTLDLGATLPEGVVDNGDGTYGVPYLTTVVARATPASRCFDFTEWSDSTEVNADGTDTLTIVEDYSLTATFVRHDFPGDTTASECDQFTWHDSTYTVTPETAPTFLYTTADECDSTVTLYLTIRHQNTGIDEQEHCDTYTWINNETYTESDSTVVYTLEGANAEGCDSVVTLHLTIRYSTEGSFTAQANVSYEWLDETFTADGVYTRVITNAAGCDSTVTMTLSIMPVNTPIPDIYSLMDVVLIINHNPGNLEDVEYVWYRWYRNGVLVKEGADADSYDEGGQILDGCYYLEVCTDLTQNYWVRSNELCFGTTGIDDAERVSFRVAPNPASRGQRVVVAVENAGDLQGARLTVYDAQGRKAIEQSLTGSFEASLSAGVYMLRLTTADGRTATQRLVVR